MDKFLKANRKMWDAVTPMHVDSALYDVAAFRKGKCTLSGLILSEVGPVAGEALLHLQCHFGLDTMSWARLGAKATGIDFSEKAIEAARALSTETGIDARFILSDLYELPRNLSGQFDIVFTSMGVLNWLPDIRGWARVVSHFVKPGGFFYIFELHPFAYMFDDTVDAATPILKLPYFRTAAPLSFDNTNDYAGAEFEKRTTYEWPFSLSDVVTSLAREGLRLEFLHEFPFTTYKSHPWLVKGEDGLWRRAAKPDLPMTFSLRAVKG